MMAQNPEISVVIPSYNCAGFIVAAVESVMQQEGIEAEIIVVDDGSTDGTEKILEKYIENGILKYIKQGNKGPSAARNTGIKYSTGEHICFLDADDILYPNSLSDRLALYKKYPGIGLVFSDYKKVIRKNGKDITYRERDLVEINFIPEVIDNYVKHVDGDCYLLNKEIFYELVLRNFIWTGTVMIKREVINDTGDFDIKLKIAEDHDLWLKICKKYDIGFLNKNTAAYIMHDGGISKNIPLYYDASIFVRMQYLHDLPKSFQDKLVKKMAMYNFNKGYHFYEKKSYKEANSAFRDASALDPLIIQYRIYFMLTLFKDNYMDKILICRNWLKNLLK